LFLLLESRPTTEDTIMGENQDQAAEPTDGNGAPASSVSEQIREAAYEAWVTHREPHQVKTRALFDRAYLGHYAAVAAYTEQLVDDYELDAKLDTAIAEPFRPFVDIDVVALSRSLVRNGSLYALTATPIGVWVFNGDME
jgi:hypothetical protein